MQVYAYTGDVKFLKDIGYKFQKLYAKNHKTYIKDKLFLFVIEGMIIEYSRLDLDIQKVVIDFILKNKDKNEEFWMSQGRFGKYGNYCVSRFGNLMTLSEYTKKRMTYYKDMKIFMENEKSEEYSKDELDKMFEVIDAKEFSRDPYYIDMKFIKLILELNKMHPLALITINENDEDV